MNQTLQIIERSIFKAILDKFVESGYSVNPNNPQYTTGTTAAEAAWESALKNIADSDKKFAVEVFGVMSTRGKGEKRTPRIVIEPMNIRPGDIANGTVAGYEPNPLSPDSILKVVGPFDSTHLTYDIHLIYETTLQYRVLHTLLSEVLGSKAYIPLYNNSNQRFFIEYLNYYNFPSSFDNLDEKVYTYEVKDVYLGDSKVIDNIVAIKEITVEIEGVKTDISVAQHIPSGVVGYEYQEKMVIDLSTATFETIIP